MDFGKLAEAAKELDKKVDVQGIAKDAMADGKLDKTDAEKAAKTVSSKLGKDGAADLAKKVLGK